MVMGGGSRPLLFLLSCGGCCRRAHSSIFSRGRCSTKNGFRGGRERESRSVSGFRGRPLEKNRRTVRMRHHGDRAGAAEGPSQGRVSKSTPKGQGPRTQAATRLSPGSDHREQPGDNRGEAWRPVRDASPPYRHGGAVADKNARRRRTPLSLRSRGGGRKAGRGSPPAGTRGAGVPASAGTVPALARRQPPVMGAWRNARSTPPPR